MSKIINPFRKNPYFIFFTKIFAFLFIVWIIDYSFGRVLDYFYFKQKTGFQYQTTYSIDKTKAEILIFGSSRANHHYDPAIFENCLNTTCYNTGRDGSFIFYNYAILKGVTKRYLPKTIILDFVKQEFEINSFDYDRLSALLPYYNSHPEIRTIVELKSDFEKFKLISQIYPFNSSIFTIAYYCFGKSDNTDELKMKGYLPLTKTWNGIFKHKKSTPDGRYELDKNKVNCFRRFLQECQNKHIKIYVIVSPYLINSEHDDYSVLVAKEMSQKFGAVFLDYSNDSSFTANTFLFADEDHLNTGGAKIFSTLIANKLGKPLKLDL